MLLEKNAGANYSAKNLRRVTQLTSNRTGLKAEFMFGRDFATSKLNSAGPNAPSCRQTGTLTYASRAVTGSGLSNYLTTWVPDNAALTIILFARQNTAGLACYCATGNDVSPGRIQLYNDTSSIAFDCVTSGGSGTDLEAVMGTPTTPLTAYRAIAARVSGAVNPTIKCDEFMGGVRTKGGSHVSTSTRAVDDRPIQLGPAGATVFTGSVDYAGALIYHRYLSDAELLGVYIEAWGVFAGVGVAV